MTSFLILAALMTIGASLFFVPTLWRAPKAAGAGPASKPEPWTAVWLVTGVVIASVGLYLAVGSPQALGPRSMDPAQAGPAVASPEEPSEASPAANAAPSMTPAQIEGMVARLAQRLQSQPNDPEGWRMLARSYETLGRFAQAAEAYKQLLAVTKPDPDLLTDYAVTLGMSLDKTLVGEPEALIDQALKLNPRHIQALALSGSAAFEKKDYRRAIAQWTKILSLVPPEAEMRASIQRNIAQAESLAKQQAQ